MNIKVKETLEEIAGVTTRKKKVVRLEIEEGSLEAKVLFRLSNRNDLHESIALDLGLTSLGEFEGWGIFNAMSEIGETE